MASTASDPRHSRQQGLVPPDRLNRQTALVVGCGAVGRQCALMLASTGVPRLRLVDFDTVEEVNLGPQAYRPTQLGHAKAGTTTSDCCLLNPDVVLQSFNTRFRRSEVESYLQGPKGSEPVVFCCVDDIDVRKLVWESVRGQTRFFADARVAAEVVRILASDRPTSDTHYNETLFARDEAYVGTCTARMTVFLANLAAGLMLAEWSKWLRGLRVTADQTLNLLASELSVGA